MAEFKNHVAGRPETDAEGEPTEVWLESGRYRSSLCARVEVLNRRVCEDGTPTGDLLLGPQTAENDEQPASDQPASGGRGPASCPESRRFHGFQVFWNFQ